MRFGIWRPDDDPDPVAVEYSVTVCKRSVLVVAHVPGSRDAVPVEVTVEADRLEIESHLKAIRDIAVEAYKCQAEEALLSARIKKDFLERMRAA
jgi:hypothetical protein